MKEVGITSGSASFYIFKRTMFMPQRSKPSSSSISRLKEISRWISSVNDMDQLLELIIYSATEMMQAKASSLLLVDEKTNNLYFKVATGEKKEDVKKFEIQKGKGIVGHVAITGEPLLIEDVKQDPRWFKELSESIGFETQSIICAPIKYKGKTIGVVEFIDKTDGKGFQQEDIIQLMVFADLAAIAIGNARQIQHVRKENIDLRQEIAVKYELIGESQALQKVVGDAIKVANSNATTLVIGESGTGKELLARLIHRAGLRKNQALICINCAALPETLLEDELFGHEKGAYTGATARKIGKFEQADGGTLFLDEIGEMSPSMQAKLLRALQEGVFYRVGGTSPIHVDVRVLAATNRDIENMVSTGRFREDLYYRLNVIQIHMPPLRERMEDIPMLARYFLNIYKKERGVSNYAISARAMQQMCSYQWPGNVRELKNAIERAVVMGNGVELLPEDLPIHSRSEPKNIALQPIRLDEATRQFKRQFIIKNLERTGGNRSEAAKNMGIQRTYLSRLIRQMEITDI